MRKLAVSQSAVFTSVIHLLPLDFRPEDFIDTESPVPPDPEQPDCTKILELPYSIHAFQHLRVSGKLWGMEGTFWLFGGVLGFLVFCCYCCFGLMLIIKSIFLPAGHLIILPTLVRS
jgi:hypothetical protein